MMIPTTVKLFDKAKHKRTSSNSVHDQERLPDPEVAVDTTPQCSEQFSVPTRSDSTVHVIVTNRPSERSLVEAYLLWLPLGLLGTHHFYLRNYRFGLLYLLTGALCGVGWIVDGVRMFKLVREANEKIREGPDYKEKIDLVDAYVLWMPFGILGLHHFYMRRHGWGVAYLFTLGFLGIGWLIDLGRMPSMVRKANEKLENDRLHGNDTKEKSLSDAYLLGISPSGIFGAHHFYLGRMEFGILYLCTLGLVGIGWIVDWFRMKWLVERTNNPLKKPLGHRHKYVDDAYLMAFPFGFLGLHHFYLERPAWGVMYFLTAGLCGIGWIVDLFRMYWLVAEVNKKLLEETVVTQVIQGHLGPAGYSASTSNPAEFSSTAAPASHPGATIVPASTSADPVAMMQPPPYSASPLPPEYIPKPPAHESESELKRTEK